MVKRLLADELSAGWLRIVGIESRGGASCRVALMALMLGVSGRGDVDTLWCLRARCEPRKVGQPLSWQGSPGNSDLCVRFELIDERQR